MSIIILFLMAVGTSFFSCPLYFFPYSRLSSTLCILFHSCCSHARVLGKHSCMSSIFPIAKLKITMFFREALAEASYQNLIILLQSTVVLVFSINKIVLVFFTKRSCPFFHETKLSLVFFTKRSSPCFFHETCLGFFHQSKLSLVLFTRNEVVLALSEASRIRTETVIIIIILIILGLFTLFLE